MKSFNRALINLSFLFLLIGCADEADNSSTNAPIVYSDITGIWTFKSNDLKLTGELEIVKSLTNTFVVQKGSWTIDGLSFTNNVNFELSLGSNLTINQIKMQNNSKDLCTYVSFGFVTYSGDFTSMKSRLIQSYEYYLPPASGTNCIAGARDNQVTFERKK